MLSGGNAGLLVAGRCRGRSSGTGAAVAPGPDRRSLRLPPRRSRRRRAVGGEFGPTHPARDRTSSQHARRDADASAAVAHARRRARLLRPPTGDLRASLVTSILSSSASALSVVPPALPGHVLDPAHVGEGVGGLVHKCPEYIGRAAGETLTADDADWLTPSRLRTWLRSVGYTGRTDPAVLHAHLVTASRGATGPAGAAAASITQAFVAALSAIVAQIHALEAEIAAQPGEDTDAHIFLSLPRAQALRAARLLAEIGDCRARFPTPESLASLAGVTPSTRQSGKMKITTFRWSADKQLHDAVCDFAADSRHDNPWAADLYNQGHHPRSPPPARRADPGPRLDLCDLAMLAGSQALRPRPSPSPPGAARRPDHGGGLTLSEARLGPGSARPPEGPARQGRQQFPRWTGPSLVRFPPGLMNLRAQPPTLGHLDAVGTGPSPDLRGRRGRRARRRSRRVERAHGPSPATADRLRAVQPPYENKCSYVTWVSRTGARTPSGWPATPHVPTAKRAPDGSRSQSPAPEAC